MSDETRRRAEYSSDAGNYRVVPQVVVQPVDTDDVLAVLSLGREVGVPVTCRGGGTSVAGNAIGAGIVLDFSTHLNRILQVDPESRTARVEPGVVLRTLQEVVAPQGLRFGPDPSTQSRATIGGMIGNNACGPHTVAYGCTADNVESLTVVDGTGRRIETHGGPAQIAGLTELIGSNLDILRTELGRFGRQMSGYALDHLLPEKGHNLAGALVGSEGTLGVVLDATVRLVATRPARTLVVLGYPDMATAADAVPPLLAHSPLAVEGLDARLVDVVRAAKGPGAVPDLPSGGGWLMVELGGETDGEAMASAAHLIRDSAAVDSTVLAGPAASTMWRIREDGAGLAGRTANGRQAWPGWEDAAVPPENLGRYLRDFESLMTSYRLTGMPYGHFGDGCIHVRLDLPLERDGNVLRQFVTDAAHLVVRHGGSCSGEHGDGRARSELLPIMYSPRMIELFSGMKALLDPDDLLNPGVLVRPRAFDADLRRPRALPITAAGGFSFAGDDGDLTKAVHRCVGVGKCRADNSAAGGFMCPSFLASGDEKDVTRGRARVLQEVANGGLIRSLRSSEVHESLDLCLSCKACASDCPAGVDMAQYKSEVLYRNYKRRLRPVSHYSLGWLPRWLALLRPSGRLGPALVNRVLGVRTVERAVLRAAGLDRRRSAPRLASTPFHRAWQRDRQRRVRRDAADPPVVLWVDSFTDAMTPQVAHAAAKVLRQAGYQVLVPERIACCGLTWITTGQLDGARVRLRRLLDLLEPFAAQGILIVGLEPSCTAVLRSDLIALLPDDPRAHRVAAMTRTLAELLTGTAAAADTRGTAGAGKLWRAPDLTGLELLVQPHCHHHAVMGFATDQGLLQAAGAAVTTLAGCCGLAGNFGMEAGHYDMSVAVAETSLLPALRAVSPDTVVLADGFSCRTQIDQLGGRNAKALAEVLADRIPGPAR